METFVTQDGVELTIKPVSIGAIQSFLGGSPVMMDLFSLAASGGDMEAAFREMDETQQAQALKDFEPLYNYCIGWGVETDPPEEALDELALLNIRPKSKREARIKWLRILVLDQHDIGLLAGRVLALSSPGVDEAESEEEPEASE